MNTLAVDPSNPNPGVYLTVNLLSGASSPGSLGLRCLCISPPESGVGDITANTEVRLVSSPDDVRVAQGRSLGFFALKILMAEDPTAQVDLISAAESAGAAATNTLTFTGTPTSNMTFRVWHNGFAIDLAWNVGETVADARTNGIAAMAAAADSIFATWAGDTDGVMNGTARTKGPCGNDITLRVKKLAGAGGALAAGTARFASGATEPTFATALATAAGTQYDYILICCSNADAQAASSNNPARLKTHITGYNHGINAKLQRGIYGSTGSIASAKTNTAGMNSEVLTHIVSVGDESLPSELGAWELGNDMARRKRESNANRVFEAILGIAGSADPLGDNPTEAERIDALNHGITLVGYDALNKPQLLRSITTHYLDSTGNQDRRCFDNNEVNAIYDYAKDIRLTIQQEYFTSGQQVKVAKDRVPGDEPLPEGVVEERDIRGTIIARTDYWMNKGVIDRTHFESIVENGQLSVKVNASDATQVDIFIPARAFKIWAKAGIYIAKNG